MLTVQVVQVGRNPLSDARRAEDFKRSEKSFDFFS